MNERGKIEATLSQRCFVGVDEVGRGCLAGPVYAAAAWLDIKVIRSWSAKSRDLLRDSKTLSARQRRLMVSALEDLAASGAANFAIGIADARQIEDLGILGATFSAMRDALSKIRSPFDLVLIDGNQKIPHLEVEQMAIVGGDNACFTIAAASILAKEARDSWMAAQDANFPEYGFARNVGYGTKLHLEAIAKHGICDLHRRTFAPIKSREFMALP